MFLNTSPKAQDEGLPCSNSGLICANLPFDPSHAIGTRGIGVRVANASGTLTRVRPLCSRIGLVLRTDDAFLRMRLGP